MNLEGWRRACVAFRVKLSRDTGVNLTAATCESLLGAAFQGEDGEEASLWRNPGIFYASLGAAIADQNQTLPLVHPDHEKVACYVIVRLPRSTSTPWACAYLLGASSAVRA
jgi:hypothetical protein